MWGRSVTGSAWRLKVVDVVGDVGAESIVDVSFGSKGSGVKVVDVGGGVGSEERRNVLLSDCGVADVEVGCVEVVEVGAGVGSDERRN